MYEGVYEGVSVVVSQEKRTEEGGGKGFLFIEKGVEEARHL